MDILTAFIEHFKHSVTVARKRTYVNYKGIETTSTEYGWLAEGVCGTCDSFFPYGPRHDTRHGHHCSCDGCF